MNIRYQITGWTLLLTLVWCLLQGRLGVGSGVLGVLIAYAIALWLTAHAPRRRLRIGILLRLALRVACDIVISNLVVARQVLFQARRLRPAWIDLPLQLPDDARVIALATIVSLTPGTLAVDVCEKDGRRYLRIHALDAPEPDAVAAGIRERYEALLLDLLK